MPEKPEVTTPSPAPPNIPSMEDCFLIEGQMPVHRVKWRPWDRLVSRRFFEALLGQFPIEEEDDLRFLLSLAMTVKKGQPDQRIVFYRKAIAQCIDLPVSRCRGENATGKRLRGFVDRILPSTDVRGPVHMNGKATTVVWSEDAIEPRILRLRDEASPKHETGGLIYPELDEDKRKITPTRVTRHRRRTRKELDEWNSERVAVPFQGQLLEYLHSHHGSSFTIKSKDAYEEARAVGEAYPENTAEQKQAKRQILQNLPKVIEDPFPLYHLAEGPGGSVRLNPRQPSLASIPKRMRRALKPNWIEMDLSQAHLAIAAGEWGLDLVSDVLWESHKQGHGSLWKDFYSHTECDRHGISPAVAKGGFKEALYALLYGASPRNIYEAIKESYSKSAGNQGRKLPESVLHKFGDHWVINLLYEARERRIEEMRESDVVRDVFGRELHYNPREHEEIRSVLSKLAQSIELKLLKPVVSKVVQEAERKNPRFKVLLWQHDGFSFRPAQKRDEELWIGRLKDCVDEANDKYPTRLEVDFPPRLAD